MNSTFQEMVSRNIILSQIGKTGQERLLKSKILVVGAGGLGNPALQYAVAAGIGQITVVDGDTVQLSNLNRQILYSPDEVGQNKAVVAVEKIKNLNPYVSIIAVPEFLNFQLARKLIPEHDVVLDCTDNFATRYLINDACTYFQKPFVSASVEGFSGQLSTFNAKMGKDRLSGTYRCLFPHPPSPDETKTCRDVGIIGAITGIMGSWQTLEAIKLCAGLKDLLINKLLLIDFLHNQTRILRYNRDEEQIRKSEEYFKSGYYENWDCHTVQIETIDGIPSVSPEEFQRQHFLPEFEKILLIRDADSIPDFPFEYIRIPMKDVLKIPEMLDQNKHYLFLCPNGNRSASVVFMLREEFQFSNVYNLTGGWNKFI
jgi:adenylyltransferase/sulfurtransferase